MPTHPATKISCHVYPVDRPNHPVNTHCQEHHVHSASSAASGAIQQIATIESIPDTSFEIRVDIDPMSYSLSHRPESPDVYDDFLIFVILDGVKVQRSKRHRSQRGPTHISGIFTHDGRSRHFKFAKLQLVDPEDETLAPEARKDLQDTLCSDEKICHSLGTIRVDIVRCELGDKKPVQPRSMGRNEREVLKTSNQMKFSEHTKKVLLTDTAGLSDAHMPNENSSRGERLFNGGKRTMRRIEWQDKHPFIQVSSTLLPALTFFPPLPRPVFFSSLFLCICFPQLLSFYVSSHSL
ncbi:hypothetical protein CROQUDRAFT_653400 [Cronartium quercuum f. sp. fusiforme G11]|uniref:DUF7918 domain-containing protein n=1 Tax=Cronartium quercuum f. sp. fusiforme G11 TaxID=708437 RepID=A0A9P6TEQ0_9BASI|nr:hypothetical protein CROQUDRAFT_653400 [Cronartium quercuum f. sp. fusiforme G11]